MPSSMAPGMASVNDEFVREYFPGENPVGQYFDKTDGRCRFRVIGPGPHAWSIVTREFRENLEWAVVIAADREISPAVATLLQDLSAGGIATHHSSPAERQ